MRAWLAGAAVAAIVLLCVLVAPVSAFGAESPRWAITAVSDPTAMRAETDGAIVVTATNVGGAATNGSAVTVSDVLPANVQAIRVSGADAYRSEGEFEDGRTERLSCSMVLVSCTVSGPVDTGDQLIMTVSVKPPSSGAGTEDVASVSGGGAALASTRSAFVVGGSSAVPFGPVPGSVVSALSTQQAGAHPDFTTQYSLESSAYDTMSGDVKDIRFDLPQGLVGSTVGLPHCTMGKVQAAVEKPADCPADTVVGMATVTLFEEGQTSSSYIEPVYNIAPSPGEPAAFAFQIVATPVRLDTSVLTDGEDNVRVTASSLSDTVHNFTTSVTIWGVPQEHVGHGSDESTRIKASSVTAKSEGFFGGVEPNQTPAPLMTNPQRCGAPLVTTMETDPWEEQGAYRSQSVTGEPITGCDLVPFGAEFSFLPDTREAGEPAGYGLNLTVPQHNEPGVLATSSLKNTMFKLPEGVVINPSAAWGLQACSNEQFYGPGRGPGHLVQEPAEEEQCPNASKVGEVEVHSPDLEVPLKGSVYLGSPECDPCTPQDAEEGKMARLLMQLVVEREPGVHILEDQPNVDVQHGEGGVIVKLEGRTLVDQQTGRLTAVLDETPELPFSDFKLVLEGGPRAVLANPRTCGAVKSEGAFTPWSEEPGVLSESTPSYTFEIDQNCSNGAQFHPSFKAGMPNVQAGAFSEFTLAFGRSDQDQYLSGISTTMPPGLLGSLSGVELCKEAQANAGTCGANSLIGTTEVLTGPGADPFLVSGGQVFLTEGYGGAPFGLSIVVPAVAGPYTLSGLNGSGEPGNGKVVVRARIMINQSTAVLSVVSNRLPTMLDGIPLQLRAVNVRINRPGFTFNPTNCNKMALTGTLASAEGMTANVSSSFQVTNCGNLKFEPKFAVTTSGKTSKADGASLTAKLSYPNVPAGTDANISKVKVELPVQLPSRLTTLQKACTNAQFETNPAGCPSASMIGHAVVHTPLVPVPLEGPAIFVSHGGEAFPSLTMVLQGYGVTVDLVGTTFISKAGITSTTFKTVPDVPFSTFELTLPQGPYSALTANGNLCALTKTVTVKKKVTVKSKGHKKTVTRSVKETKPASLSMPTEFLAQNGVPIHETTPVSVTNCPKAAVKAKAKGKKGKKTKKKGGKKKQ
jgi:hypothetical protein